MKKISISVPIAMSLSIAYLATLVAWQMEWSVLWLALALGALGVGLFFIFMFTYRMWSAIQDGYARMTPMQAVLYSFIPGFNFLWLYVCICGFAYDCNAYIKRHYVHTQPVSVRIPVCYVTAWLLALVPYVGIVSVPIAIVCVTVMLKQYVRAVDDIMQHAHATR